LIKFALKTNKFCDEWIFVCVKTEYSFQCPKSHTRSPSCKIFSKFGNKVWWCWGTCAWAYKEDNESLNFTEGLRVTEAGVRLSADSKCNKQRAEAPRKGIVRMLNVLLDTILKGKLTYLLGNYFTVSSVTHSIILSWSMTETSWGLSTFCWSLLVSINVLVTPWCHFLFSPLHSANFKTVTVPSLESVINSSVT